MMDQLEPTESAGSFPRDRRRRNIEIKAKASALDRVREIAREIATENLGILSQTDTYFWCNQGRLKLRQIEDQPTQLIWYDRPDVDQPKGSDYSIIEIDNANSVKSALTELLGIRQVVCKKREVFLYQNVRIHLDEVQDLGTFIELEAVLDVGEEDHRGQSQVAWLCEKLGIDESDLLPCSYVDLLDSLDSAKSNQTKCKD